MPARALICRWPVCRPGGGIPQIFAGAPAEPNNLVFLGIGRLIMVYFKKRSQVALVPRRFST
jgi:hypothetical protein